MAKKYIFLILLGVLVLPTVASAQITVQSMIGAAVQTTLYIASGVVVILWVITGLLFLTAQGKPETLGKAKTALLAAVAGTVLVIVAGSAIALVSGAFNLGAASGGFH